MPSANVTCDYPEFICRITEEHTLADHCNKGQHCDQMEHSCSLERQNHDHSRTCCVCGEEVICSCEPETNWVDENCPQHGINNPSVRIAEHMGKVEMLP